MKREVYFPLCIHNEDQLDSLIEVKHELNNVWLLYI